VSSVEERVERAMSAAAELVDSMPPLRLSAKPGARVRSGAARSRLIRRTTPLAAAVMVVAVAVSLVALRDIPNGRVAPSAAPTALPTGVPRYYAALVQPGTDQFGTKRIQVRETWTGKLIATVNPPAGTTFAGITGAADDLTFVTETQPALAGEAAVQRQMVQSRTWYLMRIAPGAARPVSLTRIPIPVTPSATQVDGIALSPDGTRLAIAQRKSEWNFSFPGDVTLRVYDVRTGAVLRSWSARSTGSQQVIMPSGDVPDGNLTLAWTDDGSALAFGTLTEQQRRISRADVRVLPYATPSGTSLLTARPAFALLVPSAVAPASSRLRCDFTTARQLLLTSDGRLICAGIGVSRHAAVDKLGCANGQAWYLIGMLAYSAAYPGAVQVLQRYASECVTRPTGVDPLWTSPSGDTQLGFMALRENGTLRRAGPGQATSYQATFGMFRDGRFTPLPMPVPLLFGSSLATSYIAW
jgi:hypothetical protein